MKTLKFALVHHHLNSHFGPQIMERIIIPNKTDTKPKVREVADGPIRTDLPVYSPPPYCVTDTFVKQKQKTTTHFNF